MPYFEPSHAEQRADVQAVPAGPRRATDRIALLCAVSLAALFIVAELSPPGPLVLIAAITFSFSACAWTVLLHRQWRSGQPALPPLRLIWTTLATGILAAALGLLFSRSDALRPAASVLGLAGVIVVYVGLGLAIIRIRSWLGEPEEHKDGWQWWLPNQARRLARSPRGLAIALVGMLALTYGGFLALGNADVLLVGILLGLGVLPVPAVLGLLAEHALRAPGLAWSRHGRGRLGVFVVSAVLVLLVLLELASRTRYPLPLWLGLGALVFLVAAIVTGTLADVAVFLLALALMGVAAPTTSGLADPWPQDKHVLVALGDSYMSGEGAHRFIDGTDSAGVDECRRARTAWPVLVSEREPFDGLAFLACSGAKTDNLRTKGADSYSPTPRPQYADEGTQLATYRSHFASVVTSPPLVVLSIGGNDAGFATIGVTCIAPGSCQEDAPSALAGKGNLSRVANRLRQAYAQVRDTFPASPVVVVPYPSPIYGDPHDAPCSQAPLSRGDLKLVSSLLNGLNATIREVATGYGFYVASPVGDALAAQHLQLCDPANHGKPGINFISARSVGGVSGNRFNPISWKHGSLHPNERGHAAMARAFERWLAAEGNGDAVKGLDALEPATARVPVPAQKPHDETYRATDRSDCSQVSPEQCNAQATDWAENQLGDLLQHYFWWVLVLLAGAWCLGISFSGRTEPDLALAAPAP